MIEALLMAPFRRIWPGSRSLDITTPMEDGRRDRSSYPPLR